MHSPIPVGLLFAATVVFGQNPAGSAEVDPQVIEEAATAETVRVIAYLRAQPHDRIIQSTRTIHQPGIDAARAEIALAAEGSFVDEQQIASAHAAADLAEVRVRQLLAQQIRTATAADQALVRARIEGLGGSVTHAYTILNAVAARLPSSALTALAEHPSIARIGPDARLKPRLDVSGQVIGAPAFWGVGLTGAGVSIGLIDTGVARQALYLAGAKIIDGPVFLPSNWPPYDDDPTSPTDRAAHGSIIAAILAMQPLPGYSRHQGIARGATIYNLKAAGALEHKADLFESALMAALDYGVLNTPAKIFNVSFSGVGNPNELDTIMANWNVIVVFAGARGPMNGVSVEAIDDHNTVSRNDDTLDPNRLSSLPGSYKPDLVAPGVNVSIPNGQGGFVYFNDVIGSSAAAPHVTGGLALLQQSGITDMQTAKAILINSAFGEAWTPERGWGYLDLEKARVPGSYFTGFADMHRSRFFAGPPDSGLFRATLVAKVKPGNWQRLGLFIIDRDTGGEVAGSVNNTNVQRVSVPNGNYVVKVTGLDIPTDFALALSRRGFQQMTIAHIDLRCSGPSTARLGSMVTVQCTALNSGDLEAHNVTATVGGSLSECLLDFGRVAGHSSRTRSCTAQAIRVGNGGSGAQLWPYNGYEAWDVLDPPEGSGFPMLVTPTRSGLRGVVRDSAQKPVAGVTVRLTGPVIRITTTSATGEYFFSDLAPGSGSYTITPSRTGWSFTPAAATATAGTDFIHSTDFFATSVP
jgi:hypothetical protein